MSDIWVVIVNYRGSEDTARCLTSLSGLSGLRIVVVDNTPNDPALAPLQATFPTVTFLSAEENRGFGAGNNLAFEHIRRSGDDGDVFLLNNDAWVTPDTIDRLATVLRADPRIGITAPRIVFADAPHQLWYGGGTISWIRASATIPGWMGPSDAPEAQRARDVEFASGCAMLIRRPLLDQLGGFDPRYFMYEEDVELCLRTAQAGWRIHYVPDALVYHRVQASSRDGGPFEAPLSPRNSRLTFFAYHLARNRRLTVARLGAGWAGIVSGIGLPFYLTWQGVRMLARGRPDGVAAMYNGWRDGQRLAGEG